MGGYFSIGKMGGYFSRSHSSSPCEELPVEETLVKAVPSSLIPADVLGVVSQYCVTKEVLERCEMLKNVPMFQDTFRKYPYLVEECARALKPIKIQEANTYLFHEGDVPEGMYFLRQGEVDIIVLRTEVEGEMYLNTLKAQTFFTEIQFFCPRHRAGASLRTKTPNCEFLLFTIERFNAVLKPKGWEDIKKVMGDRYAGVMEREAQLEAESS